MSLTYRRKIVKDNNAAPDTLEQNVAQALFDLENSSELKQDLRKLYITAAKEVDVRGKSAIVVFIPFRLQANFKKIQTRLVHELEKKFAKDVVIVANRKILQKVGKNNRVAHQKRPYSRTLTAVHDSILEDLVYPSEISGKRLRYRLDGSKQIKVYLDKKDQQVLGDKLETFHSVYRSLTGKDAVFTFEDQCRQ